MTVCSCFSSSFYMDGLPWYLCFCVFLIPRLSWSFETVVYLKTGYRPMCNTLHTLLPMIIHCRCLNKLEDVTTLHTTYHTLKLFDCIQALKIKYKSDKTCPTDHPSPSVGVSSGAKTSVRMNECHNVQ